MNVLHRVAASAIALGLVVCSAKAVAANAAPVSIVLNGRSVSLDAVPVERAGRLYVPLRGIFESLGASVVYRNGRISARGNGRSVSLRLGSHTAYVNGKPIHDDVAPFLIGARTMVPLRFVAEALGAIVSYDGKTRVVYINGGANAATRPQSQAFHLTNRSPIGTADTLQPNIRANFSQPVNRDTLHVTIDGVDVSNRVEASSAGFNVTPARALAAGAHTVAVSGSTLAGAPFSFSNWSFVARPGGEENYVTDIMPAPATKVGNAFTVSGMTAPNSRVHVDAGAGGTGSFQIDVRADATGRFNAPVAVNAPGGTIVKVLIRSQAPDGSTVEQTVIYST